MVAAVRARAGSRRCARQSLPVANCSAQRTGGVSTASSSPTSRYHAQDRHRRLLAELARAAGELQHQRAAGAGRQRAHDAGQPVALPPPPALALMRIVADQLGMEAGGRVDHEIAALDHRRPQLLELAEHELDDLLRQRGMVEPPAAARRDRLELGVGIRLADADRRAQEAAGTQLRRMPRRARRAPGCRGSPGRPRAPRRDCAGPRSRHAPPASPSPRRRRRSPAASRRRGRSKSRPRADRSPRRPRPGRRRPAGDRRHGPGRASRTTPPTAGRRRRGSRPGGAPPPSPRRSARPPSSPRRRSPARG